MSTILFPSTASAPFSIIFVNEKEPGQNVIDLADKAKLSLFGSGENGWQLAGKMYELGIR